MEGVENTKQNSVQIVFLSSMNRACILWQAFLDKEIEPSADQVKKLTRLVEKALALKDSESVELQLLLYSHCARSMAFIRLIMLIAAKVMQGKR